MAQGNKTVVIDEVVNYISMMISTENVIVGIYITFGITPAIMILIYLVWILYTIPTQRTHHAIMTSLLRHNDVILT